MAKKNSPLDPFDESKLAELSEPITVTVHKILNGRPLPITLPVKPGEDVPGKGWSADEVRQLDEFLSMSWSGGGMYHNTATGNNGTQMRWQSYFPVDRFPERPAPMTTGSGGNGSHAPAQPAVQQSAPQSLGGVQVMPPTPSYAAAPGWMQFAGSALPQPVQQQMQPFQPSAQIYPQIPQPYPQASWLDPSRNRDEEKFRQEREARLQLEAKIERQHLENQYKEQLGRLEQEIRNFKESPRPSGESEETKLLKAQIDELRRQGDENKLAGMIREIQQSTQQQIAALTQMVQAIAAAPKGPDPMILMLIETQKASAEAQLKIAALNAEAQKETARLQAEAAREAARTALGPREIIELVSKSNQGHDQIAGAYTRLLETAQQTYENMMNAQGPSVHPAVEMAANGIQGVLGVAQRYIEMKETSSTTQSRAAAAAAQAQAQAQVAMASQRGLAAPPAAVSTEAPLGEEDEGEEDDNESEIEAAEKELFGPALSAVQRLRAGIEAGALTPDQAAGAVLQGIDHFAKSGEVVNAFGLWKQNELGKLVQVLIPDAPTSYKEQMAGVLFEARKTIKTVH